MVVLGGEVLELATGVADPDDEGREREDPAPAMTEDPSVVVTPMSSIVTPTVSSSG